MPDPLLLTALISSVGSLIVAIATHVRYSRCLGMEIMMIKSKTTTPEIKETTAFFKAGAKVSEPISVQVRPITSPYSPVGTF